MKLFKAAKLTPIEVDPVPGLVNAEESQQEASKEALTNDAPQQVPGQKQPPVFQFFIGPLKGGSGDARAFYFYLNEPALFSEVMQMTNILSTAKNTDQVYISVGAIVSQNAARLLVSMLQACPAWKIADAPFLGNIYAASVVAVCDEIKISPYMTANFDYPQISAGGGIGDAEEALKFSKAEFEATLKLLGDTGIMTPENIDELRKQHLCSISSPMLEERFRKFNELRTISK